jgi:hypothetical protein
MAKLKNLTNSAVAAASHSDRKPNGQPEAPFGDWHPASGPDDALGVREPTPPPAADPLHGWELDFGLED